METKGKTTLVRVNVRNDLDKQVFVELIIVPLALLGRLKFAAKALAVCWGIAVLCVFIPVFHFVLVPGAIIVGLFFFYRQFQFYEFLLGGQIRCPSCNEEFSAKPAGFNWPKRETCPRCGLELILNNQSK